MRSALFYLPVWVFSLSALWLGVRDTARSSSVLYVGIGALGVTVANALMIQHRRISELERRLDLLSAGQPSNA
jgi:hypothetical protein